MLALRDPLDGLIDALCLGFGALGFDNPILLDRLRLLCQKQFPIEILQHISSRIALPH
jgi:hypothetical protein